MKQHFLAGFMSLFSGEKLASRFAPPAAKSHFEGDPTKSILDLAEPSVDRSAYLASTSKVGSRRGRPTLSRLCTCGESLR